MPSYFPFTDLVGHATGEYGTVLDASETARVGAVEHVALLDIASQKECSCFNQCVPVPLFLFNLLSRINY
jgi:hypothetical protein